MSGVTAFPRARPFLAGLLAAAGAVLSAAPPSAADLLLLKNGNKIEGEIQDKGQTYEVRTKFGVLSFKKPEVDRIVKDAAVLAAEAETLRKTGTSLHEEALPIQDDPKKRNRKLASAIELLEKSLGIYRSARAVYTGDAYAHLDKAIAELTEEIRVCRGQTAPEPAAPAAPAPPPAKPGGPPPQSPNGTAAPPPPPAKPEGAPAQGPDDKAPPPPPPSRKPDAGAAPAADPKPADPKPESLETPPPPSKRGAAQDPAAADPAPASPGAKLLADARRAAERKNYSEASSLASRVVKQYAGTPMASEAQALLESLPNPDGRLVNGFDTEEEMGKWKTVAPYRPVSFVHTTEAKEMHEGQGAGRLMLERDPDYTTGAIVLELGDFDENRFKGLSIWLYQPQPSPGRLEIAFIRPKQQRLPFIDPWGGSELGNCLYRPVELNFSGWRQIKVPAGAFQVRGTIAWRQVGSLVIYDASRKGLEVILDSLRFQEAEKK